MKQNGETKRGLCGRGMLRLLRRDAAIFAMAVLAGRISMAGGAAPFAVAFIAGCGMAGVGVHAAFIGAIVGLAALQRPIPLFPLSSCALLYALLLVFARWKKGFDRFDRLILLFTAQILLMPVFYRNGLQQVLGGIIALGVSVLAALALQNALRAIRSMQRRHVLTDGEQLSIAALFGVLLLGMADVGAFGFSLSVTLLLWFSMIACYARGVGGVAAAAALAAVLTVSRDFSLSFLGGAAVCALGGAALKSMQKLGVVGGFVCASLLLGTYVYTDANTANLVNLTVASIGFALIPKERLLALCSYLDAQRERERYAQRTLKRIRELTAFDLRHTASVIETMAGLFEKSVDAREDTEAQTQWMAQAAYGVCVDCPFKKICWRDRTVASRAVRHLALALERGERLHSCKPFEPTCRALQQIATAASHAKNQYLVQQAMHRQSARHNAFVKRQLLGVTGILDRLSTRVEADRWIDEELEHLLLNGLDRRGERIYGLDAAFPDGKLQLRMRVPCRTLQNLDALLETMSQIMNRPLRLLHAESDGKQGTLVIEEAQAYTAEAGIASAAVSDSGVNGDSTGERRMEHGRVLYALSDGMGVGEQAKSESDSALSLLFDLYEAGFSRDAALESVNRLLLERGEDMYATLDAVHLDLRLGEAEFMKFGAPPSFLYRGKTLHTVRAEALPAGILNEAIPAISKAKLRKNDAIILFSDGALDALGEQTYPAIAEALQGGASSTQAARQLLKRAQENGREDDMTVMVIRIA